MFLVALLTGLALGRQMPKRADHHVLAESQRFEALGEEEGHGLGAPPANDWFTTEKYKFASVADDKIGSLYFTDAGGHARLRLCHAHGPQRGDYHADGNWFFIEKDADYLNAPKRASGTTGVADAVVNQWLASKTGKIVQVQNAGAFNLGEVDGYHLLEYYHTAGEYRGRHPSRGGPEYAPLTTAQAQLIQAAVETHEGDNDPFAAAMLELIKAKKIPHYFVAMSCGEAFARAAALIPDPGYDADVEDNKVHDIDGDGDNESDHDE